MVRHSSNMGLDADSGEHSIGRLLGHHEVSGVGV